MGDINPLRGPCPVCETRGHCSGPIGKPHVVFCRKTPPSLPPPGWKYIKPGGADSEIFVRVDSDPDRYYFDPDIARHRKALERAARKKRREQDAEQRAAAVATDKLGRFVAQSREMTDAERNKLAALLCLPTGIFDELGVRYIEGGWDSGQLGCEAWATPERDAHGNVTGYALRYVYQPEVKKMIGHHGIYIPRSFASRSGPVVVSEGMSDTLHTVAAGLASLGRFSKNGGAEHLVALLRSHGFADVSADRPIVFFVENDQKFDAKLNRYVWPGREGTEQIARQVAEQLGRPVWICTVPPGYKDVRVYVTAHKDMLRSGQTSLAEFGNRLLEHIERYHEIVGPVDLTPVTAAVNDAVPASDTNGNPATTVISFFPPSTPPESLTTHESLARVPVVNQWCPHAPCIPMRSDILGATRFVYPPCKQFICPFCAPRKVAHCKATVAFHLHGFEKAGGTVVYGWWVAKSQWKRAARKIGRYFWIDLGDDVRYVISEHRPRAAAPDTQVYELTPSDAIARLSSAITMLHVRKGTFRGSKGWNLLDDDPDTQGSARPGPGGRPPVVDVQWHRLGRSSASRQKVAEILTAHGVPIHDWNAFSVTGRWWGYSAIEIRDSQLPDGVTAEHIIEDVKMGEYTPTNVVFTFGKSGRGPGGGSDPGDDFQTGPPGDPHFDVPKPY